jgi:hypothetical protein
MRTVVRTTEEALTSRLLQSTVQTLELFSICGNALDRVADACRGGGGVPYAPYGAAFRRRQAAVDAGFFRLYCLRVS